jgi:excisionase family DNA binding protein
MLHVRENLLTQTEVAKLTGLSKRTLERMRITGDGPRFCKLGRRVLYRLVDVDAWVASRVVASTSEAAAL